MERLCDLEKLLEISRDDRQRLKGELNLALSHRSDLDHGIEEARREKEALEDALQRCAGEVDTIACVVAELFQKAPLSEIEKSSPRSPRSPRRHCASPRSAKELTRPNSDYMNEKSQKIRTVLHDASRDAKLRAENCRRAAAVLLFNILDRSLWARARKFLHKVRRDYRTEYCILEERSLSTLAEQFRIMQLMARIRAIFTLWVHETTFARKSLIAAYAFGADRGKHVIQHAFRIWKKYAPVKRRTSMGADVLARHVGRQFAAVLRILQRNCLAHVRQELFRVKMEFRSGHVMKFLDQSTSSLLRSVVREWQKAWLDRKGEVQKERHRRNSLILLGAKVDCVTLRATFIAWRDVVRHRRTCTRFCTVIERIVRRKLSCGITSWTHFMHKRILASSRSVNRERGLAKYAAFFGALSKGTTFAAWREVVVRAKVERDVDKKRGLLCLAWGNARSQDVLRQALCGWIDRLRRRKGAKTAVGSIVRVMELGTRRALQHVVYLWIRRLNKSLVATCTRFQTIFRDRMQNTFMRNQGVVLLGRVFREWNNVRVERKHESLSHSRLLTMFCGSNSVLRMSFQAWTSSHRKAIAARKAFSHLAGALGRANLRVLYGGLSSLLRHGLNEVVAESIRQRWSQKEHAVAKLVSNIREGQVALVFGEWRSVAKSAKACMEEEKKRGQQQMAALLFRRSHTRKVYFAAWNQVVTNTGRIKAGCGVLSRACAPIFRRLFFSAMAAWGRFLQYALVRQLGIMRERQKDKLLRVFAAHRSVASLTDCISAWRNLAVIAREKICAAKERLEFACMMINTNDRRKMLSVALGEWVHCHRHGVAVRSATCRLKNVLFTVFARCKQRVLFHWLRFLHQGHVGALRDASRHNSMKLAGMLCLSTGRVLLKQVTKAWVDTFLQRKQMRAKSDQISNVTRALVQGTSPLITSAVFNAWSKYHKNRYAGTVRIVRTLCVCSGSMLRTGFATWSRFAYRTILAQHARQTMETRARRVAHFAASLWLASRATVFTQWAALSKEAHRIKANAVSALGLKTERYIVQSVFAAWSDACWKRKRRARGARATVRVLERCRIACARDVLNRWLQYDRSLLGRELKVQEEAQHYKMAATMFQGLGMVTQGHTFRAWAGLVAQEKKNALLHKSHLTAAKLFVQQFSCGCLRTCFSSWRLYCSMKPVLVRFCSICNVMQRQRVHGAFSSLLRIIEQWRIADRAHADQLREKTLAAVEHTRQQRMWLTVVLLKWKEGAYTERLETVRKSLGMVQNNLRKNAFASIMVRQEFALQETWRLWVEAVEESRRGKEEYERRMHALTHKRSVLMQGLGRSLEILVGDTFHAWVRAVSQSRFSAVEDTLERERQTAHDLRTALEKHVEELALQAQRISVLTAHRMRQRDLSQRRLLRSNRCNLLSLGFSEWRQYVLLVAGDARGKLEEQLEDARRAVRESSAKQQLDHQEIRDLHGELTAWKQQDVLRRNQAAVACLGAQGWNTVREAFYAWLGPVVRRSTWEQRLAGASRQAETLARKRTRSERVARSLEELHDKLTVAFDVKAVLHAWRQHTLVAGKEKHVDCARLLKEQVAEAQRESKKNAEAHAVALRALETYRTNEKATSLSRAYACAQRLALDYAVGSLRVILTRWAATVSTARRERDSRTQQLYSRCVSRRKPLALAARLWQAQLVPCFHAWRRVTTERRRTQLGRVCFASAVVRALQHALNTRCLVFFAQWRLAAARRELEGVKMQSLKMRCAQNGSALCVLQKRSHQHDVAALRIAFTRWIRCLATSHRRANAAYAETCTSLRRRCSATREVAVAAAQKATAHHLLRLTITVWRLIAADRTSLAALKTRASAATQKREKSLSHTCTHLRRWVLRRWTALAFSLWVRLSTARRKAHLRTRHGDRRWAERVLCAWRHQAGMLRLERLGATKSVHIARRYLRRGTLVRWWIAWLSLVRSTVSRKKAHVMCAVRHTQAHRIAMRIRMQRTVHVFRAWAAHWRRLRVSHSVAKTWRAVSIRTIVLAWRHTIRVTTCRRASSLLLCERIRAMVMHREVAGFASLRTHFERTLHDDSRRLFRSSVEISQEHDRLLRDMDRASLVHFEFKEKFRRGRKELENILSHSLENMDITSPCAR